MFAAIATFLIVLSVGILVAHALDAFRQCPQWRLLLYVVRE
jgi:hypothetical protein